jgi:elongation factor 1-alpha
MAATDAKEGKTHLGIVIVGHVDAGKSTTTGRLLFELGGLGEREMEKLKKEAVELGKESFMFAFFMDKSKEERARGVTIACTTKEFFTKSYHYTIIDAPGHRDFIKNMISGASQADVALLMVPANMGGFEKSIAKGNHKKGIIQGQTRQHARLCHLLGIEQLIVGVNKMDDPSVEWKESRFNEIRTEVDKMLTKIGYKTKKIPFIPMSGFKGDNLSHKSSNMAWYTGFSVSSADKKSKEKIVGHTLIDALELVVKPPKRPIKKVFRMPVSGVYKIKGVGDVITGRIEQGQIEAGVKVKFYPSLIPGTVFSIEMHHKTVPKAIAGDNVGLNIKGLKKEAMPRVGDVMAIDDAKLDPTPPKAAAQFTALVFVQDHPGQLKCSTGYDEKSSSHKGGFTPSIHIRTAKAPCQMIKINWKSGKSTSGHQVEEPPYIEAGDQAEIVLVPKMPLVVQPFNECKPLGRIAAMDSNSLIMLGKVTEVVYKEGKA